MAASAGAGVLTILSSQSVAAAPDESDDNDLITLSGSERKIAISSALSDPEVQKIRDYHVNKGRTIQRSDISAWRTVVDGEEHTSIFIPFKIGEKRISRRRHAENSGKSKAYTLWSSSEERQAVGHYFPAGSEIAHEADQERTIQITEVERGEVTTRKSTLSGDQISAAAPVCICTGDLDLECIAKTALAVGVASDPCKACYVDPTRVSCLACASALILAGWNLTECCTDCWECCGTHPRTLGCKEYC